MKKRFAIFSIWIVVWLVGLAAPVRAQDVQYVLNPRTGKFDAVRTANFVTSQDTASEWVARTIYVSQYLGNDTTGDGFSNLTSFRTIKKALLSVKNRIFAQITLQLDSGNYDFTIRDRDLINERFSNWFNGQASANYLNIVGLTYKEPISFTYANTSIKWVNKISGYSFTDNYLVGKFLANSSGNGMFPIESNWNDSVFVTITNTSYNNIYQLKTNLNVESSRYTIATTPITTFKYVKINLPAIGSTLQNCYIINSQINSISTSGFGLDLQNAFIQWSIINTKYNNSLVSAILMNNNSNINTCVIYNTNTRKTTSYAVQITNGCSFGYSIVSGYLIGVTTRNTLTIGAQNSNDLFFKDCGTCFGNPSTNSLYFNFALNILATINCDYLVRTYGYTSGLISCDTKQGNTLTIFNPSSNFKSFIDPSNFWCIKYPGIFSEYQQKQSVTLANNSTDSISIADLTYNRSIELKYTIQRGSNYRTGSCRILNTGTSYLFDPGNYIESADVGVTLNGVYRSGTSNTLKLKWTTTNTGTAATFNYDAYRQNF